MSLSTRAIKSLSIRDDDNDDDDGLSSFRFDISTTMNKLYLSENVEVEEVDEEEYHFGLQNNLINLSVRDKNDTDMDIDTEEDTTNESFNRLNIFSPVQIANDNNNSVLDFNDNSFIQSTPTNTKNKKTHDSLWKKLTKSKEIQLQQQILNDSDSDIEMSEPISIDDDDNVVSNHPVIDINDEDDNESKIPKTPQHEQTLKNTAVHTPSPWNGILKTVSVPTKMGAKAAIQHLYRERSIPNSPLLIEFQPNENENKSDEKDRIDSADQNDIDNENTNVELDDEEFETAKDIDLIDDSYIESPTRNKHVNKKNFKSSHRSFPIKSPLKNNLKMIKYNKKTHSKPEKNIDNSKLQNNIDNDYQNDSQDFWDPEDSQNFSFNEFEEPELPLPTFKWILQNGNLPYIIYSYIQLFFNIAIGFVIIYIIISSLKTLSNDISNKLDLQADELTKKSLQCSKYIELNQCNNNPRRYNIPELDSKCLEWEQCAMLNVDLSLGRAKITAEIIGNVINSFFEQFTIKTLLVLGIGIFFGSFSSNYIFGFLRARSYYNHLNHQSQQDSIKGNKTDDDIHESTRTSINPFNSFIQQSPSRSMMMPTMSPLPSTPFRFNNNRASMSTGRIRGYNHNNTPNNHDFFDYGFPRTENRYGQQHYMQTNYSPFISPVRPPPNFGYKSMGTRQQRHY